MAGIVAAPGWRPVSSPGGRFTNETGNADGAPRNAAMRGRRAPPQSARVSPVPERWPPSPSGSCVPIRSPRAHRPGDRRGTGWRYGGNRNRRG